MKKIFSVFDHCGLEAWDSHIVKPQMRYKLRLKLYIFYTFYFKI